MLDLCPFEDTSMLSLYRKCLKASAPLEKKGCPARNALFEELRAKKWGPQGGLRFKWPFQRLQLHTLTRVNCGEKKDILFVIIPFSRTS